MRHQGPGSWIHVRFHKRARRRDHRKLSLLVETGRRVEKFVYEWRLDTSRVADVTAARRILPHLPQGTTEAAMDPAYDSRDVYALVEAKGARPIIKPKAGYSLKSKGSSARPRALRWRQAHPRAWRRKYHRRPITESCNYALKRRFGDHLRTKGLHRQRKEVALRVLVHNTNMAHRALIRKRARARARGAAKTTPR